jgi:cytochrome d ubiquinol oxidase subunit I
VAIPKLAALYLTHEADGIVRGVNSFNGIHPPVAPVFWSFRIMVGTGLLMLMVSWASVLQLAPWKKDPTRTLRTWHARLLVGTTFAGWVALIAGWYTTEIGRQPWLVSGLLTAADAASKVPAQSIALTLALYLTLYAVLIVAYVSVVFYLARHRTHADKPFDSGMEVPLNPVNKPEKQVGNKGALHA